MRGAVYNAVIPNVIPNSVKRDLRPARVLRVAAKFSCLLLGLALTAIAEDWSGAEQQLARKIVAVTGAGAAAITMENRSSLGKRDSEVIENGLRSALEGLGVRFAKPETTASPAGTAVKISLSENATSYVWVAEIRKSAGEPVVAIVSATRPEGAPAAVREAVPLSLRKTSLWTQSDPILDVAVLEENTVPAQIAVLEPEKISLYRVQAGRWQLEQALSIVHVRPWPRDLRGRVMLAKDHLLDVILPGVLCRSGTGTPVTVSCRESDDPWPLVPAGSGASYSAFPASSSAGSTSTMVRPLGAFYAAGRNFFTGALTQGIGSFTTVPKFYSAAFLPREKYMLWLFASTDGRVHLVDGVSDEAARVDWGSDVTSVKTSCGAGWQVLATSSAEGSEDSVRAYEFPDRDPVAVSVAVEFTGAVTALWTEAKGDSAIAVVRNRETGSYEAFRLAVTCSQ
jgi:hypothetical protein